MDKGVIYDAVSDVGGHFSPEFRNHVRDQKLLCKYLDHYYYSRRWLFKQDEQPDGVDSTHSDLTNNLMTIFEPFQKSFGCLVQFWKVEELGGVDDFGERHFLLATRNLPFLIIGSNFYQNPKYIEGMCSYRMKIVNIITGDGGGGVIDRVCRSRRIEFTPDIRYYSSEEFPHLDFALSCGIKSSLAIPISDSCGCLVGVLEAVSAFMHWDRRLPNHTIPELRWGSSLRYLDSKGLCGQCDVEDKSLHNIGSEIKTVMRVIGRSYDLDYAQTWKLCSHCNSLSISDKLKVFHMSFAKRYFSEAEYVCTLNKGEGVVGKAATSSHNLVYCEDVSQFSITEYPLAHLARYHKLTSCFAICLKSNLTRSQIYVLEFFLNPQKVNTRDVNAILVPILEAMKQNFQTFTLASGEEIGDNLYVQVIDARSPDKLVPLRYRELDLTLRVGMNNIESYTDGTDDPMTEVETSVQDTSMEETSVFSASTVQSDCRLTIEVNYGGVLYTFRLSSSSEILDLGQQVSQRLNLEHETYDVKYLDDDNDWILLTCTEDLRLYIESSMRQEKYTLMLTIEPK